MNIKGEVADGWGHWAVTKVNDHVLLVENPMRRRFSGSKNFEIKYHLSISTTTSSPFNYSTNVITAGDATLIRNISEICAPGNAVKAKNLPHCITTG